MPRSAKYHHGDLRAALLEQAAEVLRDDGIDGLSLRRLGERVGVSRMAPYHHFKDKHELLCALAAEGFRELDRMMDATPLEPGSALEAGLRRFVRAYLRFCSAQPERYELMFGRPIWKSGTPTPALQEIAHGVFRRYAKAVAAVIPPEVVREGRSPLRVAQCSWATLHGLCRLLIDGIYVDAADIEEVSEESVRLLVIGLGVGRPSS